MGVSFSRSLVNCNGLPPQTDQSSRGVGQDTAIPPQNNLGTESSNHLADAPKTPMLQSPEYNEHECLICLKDLKELNQAKLACGHTFHRSCFDKALAVDMRCPICRQNPLTAKAWNLKPTDSIYMPIVASFTDDNGETTYINFTALPEDNILKLSQGDSC